MHQLREIHWQAALQILSYLKSAPGRGLHYSYHGHLDVTSYSDSGYAGDRGDRKSTSRYCTFVGGNLVTWRSKKQNVVSRSSAEAEYRAMAQTAYEMMWTGHFLLRLVFLQRGLCLCSVTTRQLSILPIILCSMKEQNTSRWIVILLGIQY